MRLFPGKPESMWYGTLIINFVKPHGAMVLDDLATKMTWIVNGSRIKHYLGGDVESLTTIVQLKESKP